MRLYSFVKLLEKDGMLEKISSPVSVAYECAYWLKRYDGIKAVIFENPVGYDTPIVGNVLCNRKMLYTALAVRNDEEAYLKMLQALNNPRSLKVEGMPSYFKPIEDLNLLPVLRSYEGEAGPYITSGIVIAKEPAGEVLNASVHRLMVVDRKHLAIRIVPRHFYIMFNKARKMGKPLPVLIIIGAPPEVYIASAASPPYGVFELEVANALANGGLRVFETRNGLFAPTESEIIILGKLLTDAEVPEGPFVDLTGTLDEIRNQPIIEVEEILARQDAVYYSILQGGREHMLLMGFPREVAIWDSVRKVVPSVKSVRLIEGGCGWLTAAISINKSVDGDAKNAILAAFAAHPSLKIAIVVDEDINVDDPNDLLWAISTRMQPDEDLIILKGVRGSSLDPSANQLTLETSKLGIDATIPLTKKREGFLKARIPYTPS